MNPADAKLSWILNVAERIKTYFKSDSADINAIIKETCSRNSALAIYNPIISEGSSFLVITNSPVELFQEIVRDIKNSNLGTKSPELNPINILTKVFKQEYLLDANGTRLCYGIEAAMPSRFLAKSIACQTISTLNGYYEYLDQESHMLTNIECIHPNYDFETNQITTKGGKKNAIKHKQKKNIRLDIIGRLIAFVRDHPNISTGIIFVNSMQECAASAINIIYTDRKYYTAIADYLKLLISENYKGLKFKSFLHNEFNVPYSLMMTKHSCLLNDSHTGQATYIANLYNIATYMPVPCVKEITKDKFIHIAHPIIKLRFLYLDLYLVEAKTKSLDAHADLYQSKLMKAYSEVSTYDNTPTWVGVYKDEAYEKIQYNMKSSMTDPSITLYV